MKRSQTTAMAIQNVLNAIQRQPEKPEHKRVRRIVDLLMRLQACPNAQGVDFIKDEDELHRLLSGYKWEAAVLFRDKLRIGFQPRGGSGWEGSAVSWLVRFAETGELGRLRACGACRRLFYAFRDDKGVCNAICKAKKYDADPKHHAARLERLRNNYDSKKLLKRRGKQRKRPKC